MLDLCYFGACINYHTQRKMVEKEAKRNMITQQIRAWEVLDDDTLELINSVPRERFVPNTYKKLAYADTAIPLAHGQVILPPKEVGRIITALDILPTETVLEIGTGSGYLTALLAKQANHVYSIDLFADLTEQAQQVTNQLKLDNITFSTGNAHQGWHENAPYDVIVLTGSVAKLPHTLQKDLNNAGRIFAVIGEGSNMQATLLTKASETGWDKKVLYETFVPSLLEGHEEQTFTF